jgi:hypothetical protein
VVDSEASRRSIMKRDKRAMLGTVSGMLCPDMAPADENSPDLDFEAAWFLSSSRFPTGPTASPWAGASEAVTQALVVLGRENSVLVWDCLGFLPSEDGAPVRWRVVRRQHGARARGGEPQRAGCVPMPDGASTPPGLPTAAPPE